jgi:hypothetical protein
MMETRRIDACAEPILKVELLILPTFAIDELPAAPRGHAFLENAEDGR